MSAARRFAAAALGDGPRADDLVLAASELASNAVGHSASGEGGSFTVADRSGAITRPDGSWIAFAEATWPLP